jgi:preprotein translocase subunit SecE
MAAAKETEEEIEENRVVRWLRETRSELNQVVWPSREETIRLTGIVIVISIVVGLILFVEDSLLTFLYTSLVGLFPG